ncbi:MAG TPA: NAD-dependent malic enzyme [Acidimicrobiales bacterium]|nr:NAD-dependent malic enzyme [Acidimicrobiales bacterium]
MAAPSASYSVCMRVELANQPGSLGRLATAIGQAGGSLLGLDVVEAEGGRMTRDVTVLAADEGHVARIRKAVESLDGVVVHSVVDRTFAMHAGGKVGVALKAPLRNRDDLSMAYTPGVARVCLAIADQPELVHEYTVKSNSVAVLTDGTAVLGLGDIGPYAALPVMEGKAMLFKEFAGIDAFPVCARVSSAQELVELGERLEPAFGGINLEDVAAPRCFEVEDGLQSRVSIPVFHDDQHGTAVVVLAALWNALEVAGRRLGDCRVVVVGAGAAGVAVARILAGAGAGEIVVVDRKGAIHRGRGDTEPAKQWLADNTNPGCLSGGVGEALRGAHVLVGVSGPGLVTRRDLEAMAPGPVVFALANPDPEVAPEEAEGLASVVATGRSDYPNQINNVLCFPGLFRGALDAGATRVTEAMKLAAARAIASCVPPDQLSAAYVVPSVFDRAVVPAVAQAVAEAARADGVVRRPPGPAGLS